MKLLCLFLGISIGIAIVMVVEWNKRAKWRKIEDDIDKFGEFYAILWKWVLLKQEKKSLLEYFEKNCYTSVAIYGMKELGELLYKELEGSNIQVKYAIDRDADNILSEIKIYKPDDVLEEVDVVIVTAAHYFHSIEKQLSTKLKCPIISIADVVWET